MKIMTTKTKLKDRLMHVERNFHSIVLESTVADARLENDKCILRNGLNILWPFDLYSGNSYAKFYES